MDDLRKVTEWYNKHGYDLGWFNHNTKDAVLKRLEAVERPSDAVKETQARMDALDERITQLTKMIVNQGSKP